MKHLILNSQIGKNIHQIKIRKVNKHSAIAHKTHKPQIRIALQIQS